MNTTERTSGLRGLLSSPTMYDLLQQALGSARVRRILVDEYIKPVPGLRMLDIGCGTAETLNFMPAVEYVGFDPNPSYVERARRRAGPGAEIVCDRVSQVSLANQRPFDLVCALFVLHHLDDGEAGQLFDAALKHLKPGGLLLTIDPVFAEGQSSIAKFIISRDRGAFVRNERQYRELATRSGVEPVQAAVRHDLLNIPYSHCILMHRKAAA